MNKNLTEHLKNIKVIELWPYLIISESDLDMTLDRIYIEGRSDYKRHVISQLEKYIKDETLKNLLIDCLDPAAFLE